MKQRQLLWLGGGLVLLLGIAYLAGVFDTEFSTVDVPEIDIPADEVREISVSAPDVDVVVRKVDGTWRMMQPMDAPADSEAVRSALDDLAGLELRSVVSTTPDRYGRYGVDSTGTEIALKWEGGERTVTVGDTGPGAGSRFVRLEGDESVYLANSWIRVPINSDEWRDKTIVDLHPENVSAVSISGPERGFTLERENASWSMDEGGTTSVADSAATLRYLERFSPFRADGFFEEAPASADTVYVVRFELADGAERVLELRPADGDFAVTSAEDPVVHRLRGLRLSQFVPEASYFETSTP